jgi:hypothetical protein
VDTFCEREDNEDGLDSITLDVEKVLAGPQRETLKEGAILDLKENDHEGNPADPNSLRSIVTIGGKVLWERGT